MLKDKFLLISLLIIFANQTSEQHKRIISWTAITLKYFSITKKTYPENSSQYFNHSEFFRTEGIRARSGPSGGFQQIGLQTIWQPHEMERPLQVHSGGRAAGEQNYCTESGQRASGISYCVQKRSLGKNALLPSPNTRSSRLQLVAHGFPEPAAMSVFLAPSGFPSCDSILRQGLRQLNYILSENKNPTKPHPVCSDLPTSTGV